MRCLPMNSLSVDSGRSANRQSRRSTGFRADLIVEDRVIVEIKSNFNAALIKDGTTRIVNGLEDDSHAKSPGRQEHP